MRGRFKEIDWTLMGLGIGAVVVTYVYLKRNGEEKAAEKFIEMMNDLQEIARRRGEKAAPELQGSSSQSMLRAGVLLAGETREGFIFFNVGRNVSDWNSARLAAN